MNKIGVYLLILPAALSGCNNKTNSSDKKLDPLEYELVEGWPQLSPGYVLSQPTGIGIDSNQHVFVFQRTGRKWTNPFPDSLISVNTILELENETGKLLNSWGANQFIMPHGLTVDKEDNVWVTDVALHQIFKFSHDGQLLMQWGVPKVSGNDSTHFYLPTDVAITDDGSFYVSDGYGNSRVVKFSPTGKYLFQWGAHGNKPGEFDIPHGITLDNQGHVYVADRQNNRIQVFDANGNFQRVLKNNETVAQLPSVTMDRTQNLFAIDFDGTTPPDTVIKGSTVFKYDSAGNVAFHFGETGTSKRTRSWFHDIAVDSRSNIYVCDIVGLKVLKYRVKSIQDTKDDK